MFVCLFVVVAVVVVVVVVPFSDGVVIVVVLVVVVVVVAVVLVLRLERFTRFPCLYDLPVHVDDGVFSDILEYLKWLKGR